MIRGKKRNKTEKKDKTNLFKLLKPYKGLVGLLILFALLGNGANLIIPKIISHGIDTFTAGNYELKTILIQFILITSFF